MIITEKKLREHCTVIKKVKLERFFIKEEDNYFTLYEKSGNIVGIVLEVSFSNMWMQEDELWGIINKNTRGNNIFIEQEDFDKIVQIEKEKKEALQTKQIKRTNNRIINEKVNEKLREQNKIVRIEEKLNKENSPKESAVKEK